MPNYQFYGQNDNVQVVPVQLVDNEGNLLAVNTNGVLQTVQNRPSQGVGRVYKTASLDHVNSGQTAYTVTNGKVLYVTSIIVSGYNSSALASGHLQVRDNTTVKLGISIPSAGIGALASLIPSQINSIPFIEPLQFSTNFNIAVAGGSVTYSVTFTGYEE